MIPTPTTSSHGNGGSDHNADCGRDTTGQLPSASTRPASTASNTKSSTGRGGGGSDDEPAPHSTPGQQHAGVTTRCLEWLRRRQGRAEGVLTGPRSP